MSNAALTQRAARARAVAQTYAELEALARAMVNLHAEHGTVLTVHIQNMWRLLENLDAARASTSKPAEAA